MTRPRSEQAEYLLPLRWNSDEQLADLTAYLRLLTEWIDVIVVDGSDPPLFAAHAAAWDGLVRHLPVSAPPGRNGKVRGVLTGVAAARGKLLVLADDDVRYDRASLEAVLAALDAADLVRPQNHFVPAPWHARWDTARSLLNRGLGSDYPGTFALRRSTLERAGGYDADVLFENLELERTIRAHGGTVQDLPGVFVARRPPSTRGFFAQRVRQAYDSQAQPLRLVAELAIAPLIGLLRRRPAGLLLLLAAVMLIAERGRRRAGGRRVFPPTAALWVGPWILERAATSWIALVVRCCGGVPYAGSRIRRAATSMRVLRRRAAHAPAREVASA